MLFDMQLAVQILDADVVDVEVVARGDGANAVENIFRAPCPRNGMHDHVGIGQDLAHARPDGIGDLLGALEGEIAFQGNRNVSEVAVASFAKTEALDFEHAIDRSEAVEDLAADAGWAPHRAGHPRFFWPSASSRK